MTAKLDDEQEKPLDPAVERVRRKLVRFVAINLGLLFLALMAVAVAIVYKSGREAPAEASPVPDGMSPASGRIILPQGARLSGQTLSGDRLLLDVTLADGAKALFVFDISRSRMIGRYDLRFEGD